MKTKQVNYRALAEKWIEHITGQYDRTRICRKDLPLIEHFLRAGFTLIAVRGASGVVQLDFLRRRSMVGDR